MFSSLLPNVSSNMKFAQNGAPKPPSNRFSVRMFKSGSNAAPPYPLNAKPDLTYRAPLPPPSQQHNANWYNNSYVLYFRYPAKAALQRELRLLFDSSYNSYDHHQAQLQAQRPRAGGSGGGSFSIYPSANGDTFIYQQSTSSKSDILSLAEPDSPSSTTNFSPSSFFSPALSTDSTTTLVPEQEITEPAFESQQRGGEGMASAPAFSGSSSVPVARAPSRSGYTTAPQGPVPAAPPISSSLSRTASMSYHRHMHEAQTESIEEQQRRARQASLPPRSSTPFRPPGPGPSVAPSQPPAPMARTSSTGVSVDIGGGMIMGPDGVIQVPEFEPSTMSEMEVLERDKIAKINAGYNAASSAAYFVTDPLPAGPDVALNMRTMSTSPTPRPIPMSVPMPMPMPNLQTSLNSGRDYVARVASSQPLPPNLSAHNVPLIHDSPPSVERIPSDSAPGYPPQQAPARRNTPSPRQSNTSPAAVSAPYNVSKPEPPRLASYEYRTSSRGMQDSFDNRSAQSTYATSAPEMQANNQGYRQERDRDRSPPSEGRRRRPSVAGPRPDLGGLRQSSDVREYGSSSTEYRRYDTAPPKSASESSSSTLRERDGDRERDKVYGYSRDRRDAPTTPVREVFPSHSSRNAPQVGSDPKRESRMTGSRDAEDYRRSSGYTTEAVTSSKDSHGQYKSGPLTSSPTQVKLIPRDPASDDERSHERTRTRSNSFSASARPTFAIQTPASDSRYTSDYERSRRSNERPSYKEEELPSNSRRMSRAELDRRGNDQRVPSSQAYHSQTSTIPLPTLYDGPSVPIPPSASLRTVDYPNSSQHPVAHIGSHSRPSAVQESSSSRFRVVNANPDRHSDEERPNTAASSHQSSRSAATSYDKHTTTANAKYTDPALGRDANRSNAPNGSEPTQRRHSDGDQKPPVKNQISGKNSTPALRSVRWNENLICPSPIFASQRRKGWFNRRGDQLWTNDGQFKAAPAGQEFPADLNDYPEAGEGWMNEEGVRIDLSHHLVPKAPLRSALKQTRIN